MQFWSHMGGNNIPSNEKDPTSEYWKNTVSTNVLRILPNETERTKNKTGKYFIIFEILPHKHKEN